MMKWPLFTLAMLLAAKIVSADANLEIPSYRFDFGMMTSQSSVAHSFWFRSTGLDTVRIEAVKTGCQCTTMPLERDWLAPGDSMKVEVFWELDRRVGNLSQNVRVFIYGDPEPHFISLKGKATQGLGDIKPVSVKPYKAVFAKTASLSVDSISFAFTNNTNERLALTVVSYSSEAYHVNFPSQVESGATVEGFVKITPQATDVEFKGSITIEFEGKKKNRLTIPVMRKFY